MGLNFTKIYRRINLLENVSKYFFKNLFSKVGATSKDKFEVISLSNCDSENVDIAFLGRIDREALCGEAISLNGLKKDLDNPDVVFLYCEGNNGESVFDGNIIDVSGFDKKIVKVGKKKIGCALYKLNEIEDIFKHEYRVLKTVSSLKKQGADFKIAFVDVDLDKESSKHAGAIKKKLGMLGFDVVICFDSTIKMKRNFRRTDFNETRIVYSMGRLLSSGSVPMDSDFAKKQNVILDDSNVDFEEDDDVTDNDTEREDEHSSIGDINEEIFKPAFAYRIQIRSHVKGVDVAKEGYIPFICKADLYHVKSLKKLVRPVKFSDEYEHKYYVYFERKFTTFRNWDEQITIGDLFEVLQEKMPEKYQYLSDYTVNSICARTFEISPGGVFFFRQAFNDKNDLKKEREFKRNRLVIRALTRKSRFIFSYKKLFTKVPHIVIEDAVEAHIKVMAWYRQKFLPDVKFIGVTGSIGKTSTKDMLFGVMSQKYRTQRNLRNTNVQVKIGINLQSTTSDCEMYIQEIGGGRPGGASRHSRMVLPEVAVVTNIGTAHIGNYESQEDLMYNKLGIKEGFSQNGTLFLNADDPLLVGAEVDCNVVYFAVKNRDADYYAEDIIEEDGNLYFNIVCKGKRIPAKINVLGEHNVLNAVCAYAIGKHYGIDDESIVEGISEFRTSGVRQNVINVGRLQIFADCFNASIDSLYTTLNTLSHLHPKRDGKRIAIIGDITGVGELQEEINKKVASAVENSREDITVLYGANAEMIRSNIGETEKTIEVINDPSQLEQWMHDNVEMNDVIALKGSSKARLDELIDNVFGTALCDQRYIDESKSVIVKKNGFIFRVFEEFVALQKCLKDEEKITVPSKLLNKKITKINRNCFADNKYVKVINIGEHVKRIGKRAFSNCENLEKVVLAHETKFISAKAFEDCPNLNEVVFGNEIIYLGRNAFSNCESLRRIDLPSKVDFAHKGAFSLCGAEVSYRNKIVDEPYRLNTSDYIENDIINVGDFQIYTDCFRASLASFEEEIRKYNTLKSDGKKIIILSDIVETTNEGIETTSKIANILKHSNENVCVSYCNNGSEIKKVLSGSDKNLVAINDKSELVSWIMQNVQPADMVMIYGTYKNEIFDAVDCAYGTNLSEAKRIHEMTYEIKETTDFRYVVFEEHISLLNYIGEDENVSVPDKLSYGDINKVTGRVFCDNDIIKSVKIGNSVNYVGNNAFGDCKRLEKVKLGDNVKYIGVGAFRECESLQEIYLGENLIFIAKDNFAGCNSLKEIVLPDTVRYVHGDAFSNCSANVVYKGMIVEEPANFNSINFERNYIPIGDVRIYKDCFESTLTTSREFIEKFSKLKTSDNAKKIIVLGDIDEPNLSPQELNNEIAKLLKTQVADKILLHGLNAFQIKQEFFDSNADVVAISEHSEAVNWLEDNVLNNDIIGLKGKDRMELYKLFDEALGTSLYDVRNRLAFDKEVMQDDEFSYISFRNEIYIDRYHGQQTKLVVPEHFNGQPVKSILSGSFSYNKNLEEVVCDANVTCIGREAFKDCGSLKKISLKNVKFIGKDAFEGCYNLEEVILGDQLKFLEDGAFRGCKKIKKIELPKSLE